MAPELRWFKTITLTEVPNPVRVVVCHNQRGFYIAFLNLRPEGRGNKHPPGTSLQLVFQLPQVCELQTRTSIYELKALKETDDHVVEQYFVRHEESIERRSRELDG